MFNFGRDWQRSVESTTIKLHKGLALYCACVAFLSPPISLVCLLYFCTRVFLNAEHMRVRKLEGKIEQVREMSERPGDGGGGERDLVGNTQPGAH